MSHYSWWNLFSLVLPLSLFSIQISYGHKYYVINAHTGYYTGHQRQWPLDAPLFFYTQKCGTLSDNAGYHLMYEVYAGRGDKLGVTEQIWPGQNIDMYVMWDGNWGDEYSGIFEVNQIMRGQPPTVKKIFDLAQLGATDEKTAISLSDFTHWMKMNGKVYPIHVFGCRNDLGRWDPSKTTNRLDQNKHALNKPMPMSVQIPRKSGKPNSKRYSPYGRPVPYKINSLSSLKFNKLNYPKNDYKVNVIILIVVIIIAGIILITMYGTSIKEQRYENIGNPLV